MNKLSLKLLWKALEFADDANASRIAVCNRYLEEMGEDGKAVIPSNLKGVPILRFPIICHDARDHRRLKRALADAGVEAGIFNWSPSMGQVLGRRGECPSADHIASNILNLPSHPYVTDEEVERIVATIRRVCG